MSLDRIELLDFRIFTAAAFTPGIAFNRGNTPFTKLVIPAPVS